MSNSDNIYAFLEGGGEMGERMRAHDWSSTPLGPIESWSQSLKTACGILLRSPVPIVMLWDEDGIMIYNDAYSIFAGGRHPELLGSKVREGWPEVAEFNDNVMKVVLGKGETLAYRDMELELNRRGALEPAWMDLDYSPVLDDDGRRAGVIAIVVETTDRILAERALRESETRLRFLDDLTKATTASLDADEILRITTHMTGEHLGVSVCAYADMDADQDGFTIRGDWAAEGSHSIVGHYSLADFGQLAVERLGAGLPLIINDNATEIAPHEAATFQSIGIRATICLPLVKEGRLTALMAIHHRRPHLWTPGELALITEVTERSWAHVERARTEADLRDLNEQLESRVADALAERRILADIVDNTDAFVQVADLDYNWLAINKAASAEFKRVFGVEAKVGDNMLGVLADQPQTQADVKAVWARAMNGERYTDIARFTGSDSAYEMRFDILRDASGRQIGAYQFVYDVTERLRDQARLVETEAALHQSQKMETVGQLTGGVAHDFNNLLTPIVGALDMLRGRLDGDQRATRLADGALQAADRAQTLVQRLLAFSRRQHLAPRAVDVRGLVEGMTDLMSRSLGPRIRMMLVIADKLPPAHVDPNQLELALLNLAVNARDAMGDDGVLTIRAGLAEHNRQPMVCIAVTDTGEGMDEATLKRAIEPFFTTKGVGRGTGLGLSSVQGLAVQSGGAFELSSRPGQGTTATLWLPISDEAVEVGPERASADAVPRRNASILLVDDEELVRMGTADMLTEAGYTVEEANSGIQALAKLRGGLAPDLLITDYAMPGMTGAELARQARSVMPNMPVLMITGYATLTDREAGGLPRLAKPFRQADLAAAASQLLEGPQAGA